MNRRLSDHFWEAELRCSHCWVDGIVTLGAWEHEENIAELEAVRSAFNQEVQRYIGGPERTLPVNSAHRCPLHPEEIDKPDGPGEHCKGMAVDFGVFGFSAPILTVALVRCDWKGVGWQQKGSMAGRYVHADRGARRAWTY